MFKVVSYQFNSEQYFVIEEFDKSKAFSSFLPGLAGLVGIPLWSFYVNRGQGMVSFGIKDKNHAITEFFPANQAYQRVETNGFRTFIKIKGEKAEHIYEPFSSSQYNSQSSRNMYIKDNEFIIEEINKETGIKVKVIYFTLPNENFAALVRKVEIENTLDQPVCIEVVDGLPAIIPYGVEDAGYKAVGNTLKSWMDVFNLDQNIPYYRVRSSTNDSAKVEEITKGHFYLSFVEDGELLSPIVDNLIVFETNTAWTFPNGFAKRSISELIAQEPITANKVPSGFSGFSRELNSGEKVVLNTLIGHVSDIDIINQRKEELAKNSYINQKYQEAQKLAAELTKDISTKTSVPLFDAYIQQSYLDNLLRGGYPILLRTDTDPFVYYVFSRKHGDLERDYNFFSLAPEYYSQGNGNFRDVNQNRRNDVFFKHQLGDYNIKLFMNLIQPDGYNPLVVKGASFEVIDQNEWNWLFDMFHSDEDVRVIQAKLNGKYTPGDLVQTLDDFNLSLKTTKEEFLKTVLSRSKQNIEADFGEGFWTDHWTYNLDLIENYLKIYPDKAEDLLFGDSSYKYFDSHVFVNPRDKKYVLSNGKVRQYNAIEEEHGKQGNWITTQNGQEYTTNLFTKLINLALVKFSTLDPYGLGIEMEANKPGWNDAMNGLPGLLGSGMSETFELKRLISFILEKGSYQEEVKLSLPVEVAELLSVVDQLIEEYQNGLLEDFRYWDDVSTARENYREAVKTGFEGIEKTYTVRELLPSFRNYLSKINDGIRRAVELGNGITPTFLTYEAVDYELVKDQEGQILTNKEGNPFVKVLSVSAHALPHFLEGPARYLKTITDKETALNLYHQIRESEIYDRKLKMYKTSSPLDDESFEIGRSRAFTPGWLERESVFMHMEFKYLLSVLKAGLYDEFFEDLKYALPPFMKPEVYGRSTLENSSFIASSVNVDPTVHGQGFVARLSGTTAEFISMWQMMMMGKQLFTFSDKGLSFKLQPILPDWLFDEAGEIHFTLLSDIEVTYINSAGKNTYGPDGVKVQKYRLFVEDRVIEIEGDSIKGEYAELVREKGVRRIEALLV